MNKKTQQFSTRDKILNIARNLFLSQGFAATSIDQICRQIKVTKGGFFHYFKSKDELGKAVLERFCQDSHKAMKDSACCQKCPDPLNRIFLNLDCIIQRANQTLDYNGCLIASFAQEMSQTHPAIQEMCAEGLRGWAKMIKDDLKLAQKKYIPRSSLDVNSLADHCVSVIEGAQILAKATKNIKVIEQSINHLKSYLSMVFKKQ